MAGVTLGFLKYVLGFDTIAFRKGMTEAERDLVKMQKSFERKGNQIAGLGKSLSLGLTLPLTAFAAKGIKEAQETQKAMAQVNAALSSMGPVAGRTSAQLSKMADSLELNSLFEADEILQKVTANMLTFGNISGQAFDRAQQAAVNLATRMGTDLQSATLLVGKALNDPIKGMTAMGRAGIQFSESQKATIKSLVETGNAAGAQAIILKELERQFGGAAAAAQNADPWNKATDAFKQMAESVGTALLPLIPPLTNAIVAVAGAFTSLSPETQKWVLIVGAATIAVGPFLTVLGTLITVVAKIGPLVLALTKGWAALKLAFVAARVAALATLPALIPFLVPLAAIATAVGAVYLAWKNWDKIVGIVSRTVAGVNAWLGKLNFNKLKSDINSLGDRFKNLYDRVVGNSYIPDMVAQIGAEIAKLDALMVQPIEKMSDKAAAAFQKLQESAGRLKSVLERLYPEAARDNAFLDDLKVLDAALASGKLKADQYADAMSRLMSEGVGQENMENAALAAVGMASPGAITESGAIGEAADGLPDVIEQTKTWRDILSDIGNNLLNKIGNDILAIADGSMKLKDLWRSLLAFALQMLTSATGPLASIFGGARASGGPVLSGSAYLVGEKGPEIFQPSRSGRIISNEDVRRMGGVGGNVFNWNIQTPDADSFRHSQRQITGMAKRRLALG